MKQLQFSYDISQDVCDLIDRSGINIQDFKGKTVFVSGGTGFFGVWMLKALTHIKLALGGDLRVLALSRDPEQFTQTHSAYDFASSIEFIQGDVKTFRLNPAIQIQYLIHMAATKAQETFAGEDQLKKIDMLYLGTRNVLEQCGTSLEKVLFTSSGVAFGKNCNSFISEDDLTAPDTTEVGSALGIGKMVAEYLVANYAEKFGFAYSIARCFAFAGPYLPLDLHYAFGNFIHNAQLKQNIVIRSDGQDLRSYLYIGDATAWLLRLLAEPQNQLVNVGSSHAVSIKQLAHNIVLRSGYPLAVSIEGKLREIGNFQRTSYIPSNNKIISLYKGLSEWTSLEDIIDKMLFLKNIK